MTTIDEFDNDLELLKEFFSIHPEIVGVIEGYNFETSITLGNAYYALEEFIDEKGLKDSKTYNFLLSTIGKHIEEDQNQETKSQYLEEKKNRSVFCIKVHNAPESKLRNIFLPYYNLVEMPDEDNKILTTTYVDELNREVTDRIRVIENDIQPDSVSLSKRMRY